MTKLETTIIKGLSLRDPFIVASSHWTENESRFRALATVNPAAITLKTTSQIKGGSGAPLGPGREMRALENVFGNKFATYTDGPSDLELWDLTTTYQKTSMARHILPGDCIIGLSVLQNENYDNIKKVLGLESYGYVELNWKYTFRGISQDDFNLKLDNILDDLLKFFNVFSSLPKLVKLPREALQHLELPKFQHILKIIKENDSGLIIANSKKIRVPPSRVSGKNPCELNQGVIIGEHLFLETFNYLRLLSSKRETSENIPELVASGGIVDIGSFIDAIAAGANCVQLCTALDLWGVYVVEWFREQLQTLCKNFDSFEEFKNSIRSSPETWYNIIISAQNFELDKQLIIEKACKPSQAIPFLQEALKKECHSETLFQEIVDESLLRGKSYEFVVMQGNVSAFLLARRCIGQFGFLPIDIENVNTFLKFLSNPDFKYDFAILPQIAYDYAIKHKDDIDIKDKNLPHMIDTVATSYIELVGYKKTLLENISHVYHFGGTSSRNSIAKLLQEIKPEIEEISALKLTPLLRAWKQGQAIFAKPPLSRMYGNLCREEVGKEWGSLWETTQPLVLIASSQFILQEGENVAKSVGNYLKLERQKILENIEQSAKQLILDGFLEYCAKLLGATKKESVSNGKET